MCFSNNNLKQYSARRVTLYRRWTKNEAIAKNQKIVLKIALQSADEDKISTPTESANQGL